MLRLLEEKDYSNYYNIINEFRKTDFSYNNFCNFINEKNIEVWVIECDNKIIATGTLLFEQKVIHDFGIVAHIEDVVISEQYRKQNYGKTLINFLIKKAKKHKCYKIVLNCNDKLQNFYSKCNFVVNGFQMSYYFN